jgi:hypothetical protein
MSFIKVLKLIVAIVAAIVFSAPSFAEEINLGCFTQQRYLQLAGVPRVIIVLFDEQAKSASLFATELGGNLRGEGVDFTADTIIFQFKTSDGVPGDVLLTRKDAELMLIVRRDPAIKIIASCRKQANKF